MEESQLEEGIEERTHCKIRTLLCHISETRTRNKNVQRRVPLLPEDEIAEQIWRHALNYRFSGKDRSLLPSSLPAFFSFPSFNLFLLEAGL